MLQRKQSLFLIGAIVMMVLVTISSPFFVSEGKTLSAYTWFGGFVGDKAQELNQVDGLIGVSGYLNVVVAAIFVFCLSQFKNRKLQIKLNLISLLVLLVSTSLFLLDFMKVSTVYTAELNSLIFVFISVTIVMVVLANNGIRRDEELIKSVDRIR